MNVYQLFTKAVRAAAVWVSLSLAKTLMLKVEAPTNSLRFNVFSNPGERWIGVDMDGTLCMWTHWTAPDFIGEPVPEMVDRVQRWLLQGKNVRILTARASTYNYLNYGPEVFEEIIMAIEDWCVTHIGVVLPITAEKDHFMDELWDDRVVQVRLNKGVRV